MTKILFVCHGSICRSPMAEFIFGDLVKKANLEASFLIESAAVSREELGNPVYPPARRVLAAHGIFCGSHRARQITKGDYAAFDYLIGTAPATATAATLMWSPLSSGAATSSSMMWDAV